MRILYIHSTFVPPPRDKQMDRFFLLSENLEGDVIQPVWTNNPAALVQMYGEGAYPAYQSGRFRYQWILERPKGLWRTVWTFWFCMRTGMRLHRERRIDCIVTYSHMTTAMMGVALKLLTGAKLIVEIVTAPHLVYVTERAKPTLRDRLMKLYSDICLHVSLLSADRAHCLHPSQLQAYPLLRRVPVSVFHEFVPIAAIEPHSPGDEPYVLLVGAPWYLKGIDRMIAAFRSIASEFPGVRLKIVGHFPDAPELHALAAGSPQIEILKAMHYREILATISHALVLVLPSGCEGMPRVLIEAMAAGVPVLGSDVGGIPHMIHDGENGFVIPGGDPQQLAARLRQLLADPELRSRLGANGRAQATNDWNQAVYVEKFTEMIADTIRPAS